MRKTQLSKVMAILLSVTLFFGTVPLTVFAEGDALTLGESEDVATAGTTVQATAIQLFAISVQAGTLQDLKDAIDNAPTDGTETEIEITADIQLDGELTVDAGKNIKIRR